MMAIPAAAVSQPATVHTMEMVACVFAVLVSPESPDEADCIVV